MTRVCDMRKLKSTIRRGMDGGRSRGSHNAGPVSESQPRHSRFFALRGPVESAPPRNIPSRRRNEYDTLRAAMATVDLSEPGSTSDSPVSVKFWPVV